LFQIAWFACVLGAANNLPWIGPLVVGLIVIYHLARVPNAGPELQLIASAAVIGAAFDSLLVASGWVSYPSGQWHAALAPYWIVAMWIGFATTLNVSLGWLKGRYWLATLFGAAGGPLAYLAGAKLGGITLVSSEAALIALALGWAAIMPLLTYLAARLDGTRVTMRSAALAPAAE
jgi:hypothetical protein